jgi:protein AATF/BFR2
MSIKKSKSRLRDFDPEALLDPAPSSSNEDSGSEVEEDANAGREHYESVSKSKLRKSSSAPLDPRYNASRISRNAAEDDDSDDPFSRNFDSEEEESGSEDEDSGNGEGASVDGEASDSEGGDDSEDEGDDEDMDDGSEESNADEATQNGTADSSAEVRKMMAKEQSAVAATMSQAVRTDIEKGKAVKSQRKAFDGLLNTRIRLQKALVASNSIAADQDNHHTTDEAAIQAAETAALALLNTLTNLRSALSATRTGQKRKSEVAFGPSVSSSEIWTTIQNIEKANHTHRTSVLEKWSARTRITPVIASKGRLNQTAQQSLTDVLNNHLRDPTRLIKRTQIPRSCAPIQSSAGIPESDRIYDDADFYGLLLKELLEQRSQDLVTNGLDSSLVIQAPWQAAREIKTKRAVDTKASKGRKLRYTVHEKLQNFMAPESREEWGERQRDELFSSLLGRREGLKEDLVVENGDGEASDDEDRAEEGLLLFRG